MTPDAVNVIADNGAIVGTIPTTLRMETGQNFSLTPSLGDTERTLTLRLQKFQGKEMSGRRQSVGGSAATKWDRKAESPA
ncbi:hypothetical protein [Nocardia anaemiae]|uniref:hypothetical protein n=1 Tax=Nocardia anaemiae TaxID=263910 RepID=UPI0007A3D49E|nr:hypothetical protein [Nocardia anaemiae]